MASGPARKFSYIWLVWLASFSLCFIALYYPRISNDEKATPATATGEQEAAGSGRRDLSGDFEVNSAWQESAPPRYALQGPHGLLSAPDINAAVPTLNNRGQVVVEEQENADLAAALTRPAAPAAVPVVVAPLKISPDPEAVKQKIAAKQRELCDDAVFQAELGRLEAEMQGKNFSQRANQMPDDGVGALIKKHARLHGVDARLVWAVIRQESGFNPQAVSPKGAMGLMQLIPGTAALMGVSDPFDVDQNISGGVRFLKYCLQKFNHNVVLALAAYNAGPENVTKYQGCPPFAETRNYVLKVMRDYTGKTIALPLPLLAKAKGRAEEKTAVTAKAAEPESGLDWKVPPPKFKVAGPTWKLPLAPTIITGKIPEAIRQHPEVTRLLARQNARKPLP